MREGQRLFYLDFFSGNACKTSNPVPESIMVARSGTGEESP
jgi:hypothetical protein